MTNYASTFRVVEVCSRRLNDNVHVLAKDSHHHLCSCGEGDLKENTNVYCVLSLKVRERV